MKVEEFLQSRNVQFSVVPHREAYDAQRMAQTLHVPGHEVAKTVLLRANGGYTYVVAVLPANKSIDLERASEALGGSRLEVASEQEISEHCPDCEVGVLPPFGTQYGMKTMVDQSLTQEDEIFFEGNSHHEAIRMKFGDFHHVEEPLIASFAR